MPQDTKLREAKAEVAPGPCLRRGQIAFGERNAVEKLKQQIATEPLAFVALFVTSQADFGQVIAESQTAFGDTDVVACTTAGEIGMSGYEEGMIVAIGFPAAHFVSKSILIEDLQNESSQVLMDRITLDQVALRQDSPEMRQGFAFLVVDGLSLREDTLAAAIAPALRDLPLFGGSAGDGTRFEITQIALNGQVRENAAVLTLVHTDLRTRVFSIDHLVPTEEQMVVTDADPDRRIVKEINAEPAGREYARIVGKDPDQLDQFTFASHPVVVRFGGAHHVRAIQQVNDAGELVFFSAIDEGMVLTVARPDNMAEHLQRKLAELAENSQPMDIIGCDCILRRIEAEQIQISHEISQILSEHRVIGFSTYGEQIGTLHVNHTMTGVAIYADPSEP